MIEKGSFGLVSAEDQLFIEEKLGSKLKSQAFDALRDAAVLATTQDVLSVMLEGFDKYCECHGIRYFLFSDSLQGVVAYEDFIPGVSKIQLGMLCCEYEKLKKITAHEGLDIVGGAIPGRISFVDKDGVRRRFPRIESDVCVPVRLRGDDVFDKESLPLEVQDPYIEISIFSAIPDDFLTKRSFSTHE